MKYQGEYRYGKKGLVMDKITKIVLVAVRIGWRRRDIIGKSYAQEHSESGACEVVRWSGV